jgi:iron complex outermembrane receptor protein
VQRFLNGAAQNDSTPFSTSKTLIPNKLRRDGASIMVDRVRIGWEQLRVCAMNGRKCKRWLQEWAVPAAVWLVVLGSPAAKGTMPQSPAAQHAQEGDLTQVSIENLMNMEVTSVSKKEQKLSQVAAAIFVVTQEDVRHSGATNIPDLLRMVPGLDVAQINANTWAISARGFNSEFANKLLVLIDGRTVYTPLFGGANWDTFDVPLEDIERIEVIRGPGGTIWGANAVNGVINVITKKTEDTLGGLLSGGGGTAAEEFGTVQYGGKIEQNTNYRIFTKYVNDDHFPDLHGQNAEDGWHLLHGGFREDTRISARNSWTTEGDLYTGSEGATIVHSIFNPPENVSVQRLTHLSGGSVMGKWNHIFSDRADTTLQFYFDRYVRSGPESRETRDTYDVEFQSHAVWGTRQDVIWGLGYRHSADQTVGTIDQAFVPAVWDGDLFNAFVQDQITIRTDRVFLSVGTKFENSYFTDFDLQPSIRVAWTPNKRHTFWAAISRAARTPTRRNEGLQAALAALPGPTEVLIEGNPNIRSEHVVAYELGYRAQPNPRVSLGATVFINSYTGLESIEPLPPFTNTNTNPPVAVIPMQLGNKMKGTTYGLEVYGKWKVNRVWTLSPGYSFLHIDLGLDPTSLDTVSVADAQGSNPGNQAQLRSHVELSHGVSWDANTYFVGRLKNQAVPSYTRVDMQLAWKISEKVILSAVGQNLLQDHHLEFDDFLQVVNSSLIKRSAYAKFIWRF